MGRASVSSCLALGAALAAQGCQVPVGRPAEPDAPRAPATGSPAQRAADRDRAAAARRDPQPAAAVSVWGHVVVVDPGGTIDRFAQQLAPPALAPMVSRAQLKSMLAASVPERRRVAEHLDLGQPMGCLLANPKLYDDPVVCVVGYQGGLTQLVEDLGAQGFASGGDGVASYDLNGSSVYLRAFGEHVGVSSDPTLLAAAQSYVRGTLLAEPSAQPDVRARAYPPAILADARPEIIEFFQAMDREIASAPGWGLSPEYLAGVGRATRTMHDRFAELGAIEGGLQLEAQRTTASYRATARSGTPTAEAYAAAAAAPPLDLGAIDELPAEVFMVGATTLDPERLANDPWVTMYLDALQDVKTESGEDLSTVLRGFLTRWGAAMSGSVATGGFALPKTAGVWVASYGLKPGQDAKVLIREFLADSPFKSFLPLYSKYVKSAHRKDAFTVAGVKVDTYTWVLTPEAERKLRQDPDFAPVDRILGKKARLTMAWGQRSDRLYLVMTNRNVKKAFSRVLQAASGRRSLGTDKAASAMVREHGRGSSLLMLDVAGVAAWIKSLNLETASGDLLEVGIRLDDVLWTGATTQAGDKRYEMSLSQPFIDQLRSL